MISTEKRKSGKGITHMMAAMRKQMANLAEGVEQQMQSLRTEVADANRKMLSTLDTAGERMGDITRNATQPVTARLGDSVERASMQLNHATRQYIQAQDTLAAMAIRRMWIGSIAMSVAAAMMIAIAAYLLISISNTRAEARVLNSQIDYMGRVNQADWIPCGVDRLCARVEDKATHYGGNKEYRVIALRRVATE